jgi:hypothetical protein
MPGKGVSNTIQGDISRPVFNFPEQEQAIWHGLVHVRPPLAGGAS